MKKYLFSAIICFLSINCFAQIEPDPAHWAYGLKKLSSKQYEIHLRCTIDPDWHIYAQQQGKDFIGTATKITFNKTPGLRLIGKPIEVGKKDKWIDLAAGITNYEFSGTVDFVQKIQVASSITEIKGQIDYQTCTHKRCLMATSVNFNISTK